MTANSHDDALPAAAGTSARRFTLAQLMLWVFGKCLALAFERWRMVSADNPDDAARWFFKAHTLIYSPLRGAGIAALIAFAWQRTRGDRSFPIQPGHWFLVIYGADNVALDCWEFANSWIWPGDLQNYAPRRILLSQQALYLGIVGALAVAAATTVWHRAAWRGAFLTLTLHPLSSLLHRLLFFAFDGKGWLLNGFPWSIVIRSLYALPGLFTVVATIGDRRRAEQRDFLHWTGVTVQVALSVLVWVEWFIWKWQID